MQQREAHTTVALQVAFPTPVVAQLIDEPEPQPHRVGEIDAGDPPRIERPLIDAIGGKSERPVGKTLAAPAASGACVTAARGWIARVERFRHDLQGLRRQRLRQSRAALRTEIDVMAFLDARRGEVDLPRRHKPDNGDCRRPPPGSRGDCAGKDRNGGKHQQRVAKKIVEGQPERGDHQDERREPPPKIECRAAWRCGNQWESLNVSRECYRLPARLSM